MNCLILNRERFDLPADGWYQLAPVGEFPHAGAGVVQVVDTAACEAMANAFRVESARTNFAGLLIDFDHFSLDGEKKSEAAGWIVDLEYRGPRDEGGGQNPPSRKASEGGLYARIRWSDVGEDCVRGGRYRFLSPVWSKADCDDLGNGRLRPVRLLNAAVTNDPNIKGMVPLSNRAEIGKASSYAKAPADMESRNGDGERLQTEDRRLKTLGELTTENTENTEERFHREDAKVAKLTTMETARVDARPPAETMPNSDTRKRFKWVLGESERHCPSCAGLAGQVHTMADWDAAGLRPGSPNLFCGGNCHCRLEETDEPESGSRDGLRVRNDAMNGMKEMVVNSWSDAARAASMAVRRAKAKARGTSRSNGSRKERDRRRKAEDKRRKALDRGQGPKEQGPMMWDVSTLSSDMVGLMLTLPMNDTEQDRYYALQAIKEYQDDARAALLARYAGMPKVSDEMSESKVVAEPLTVDAGDGDPEFQQMERDSMRDMQEERLLDQDEAEAVHVMAEGLMEREAAGESLTGGEKDFLKQYREIIGDLSDVRGVPAVGNRADGPLMADAREAVRRGKAESRSSFAKASADKKQKAEMGLKTGD